MTEWEYEPAGDFDKTPLERLKAFPRHPDFFVYGVRLALHLVIRAWLRLYHRFRILGREQLPLDRPFVLVANHASHLDAVALLSALPLARIQTCYPAAAKDYFFTTLPKIAFSAVVMNAMPFDRRENPRQSLALCRELLETPEHALILFPEGTRSATGEMAPFKPGIGFLVAGTGIPVVPCALEGAFRAWPKGAWLPRPARVTLRIGAPLVFQELPQDKDGARAVAARLEQAVREAGGVSQSHSLTVAQSQRRAGL